MLGRWDWLLKPIVLMTLLRDIGVTVNVSDMKLETRKPARKPSEPAKRISNAFGNETLN